MGRPRGAEVYQNGSALPAGATSLARRTHQPAKAAGGDPVAGNGPCSIRIPASVFGLDSGTAMRLRMWVAG